MGSVLDELAKADINNFAEARRVLLEFDPLALEAVDGFALLLRNLGDEFGKVSGYDKYNLSFNEWLQSVPGHASDMVRFLEKATLLGQPAGVDPISQAREDFQKAHSVIARVYLLFRVRRDFLFGLTDLLRLRVIPTFGYLRIQAESIGLLTLIASNPGMAVEWLSPEGGRAFYKKHQSDLVKKMKSLGIHQYYEQGSEMALHSRVQGVIPGLLANKAAMAAGKIEFAFQEVGDPVDFLVWFSIYLAAHAKFLGGLAEGVPEVDSGRIDSSEYCATTSRLMKKVGLIYANKTNRSLEEFLGKCT